MLKVVVFDCGYGGEFFADRLAEAFPVLEIIRVIDWRNADTYLVNRKRARDLSKEALRPYIGKVDLIILANHLLSLTSLKYYKRNYKDQPFVGMNLKFPDTFIKNNILILTTNAVKKTASYHYFSHQLKRSHKTIALDSWPSKIDDGILTEQEIKDTLSQYALNHKEIILACSQFDDIKKELKRVFGANTKIYDSFDDTIREVAKTLHLRGGYK